MTGTDSSKSIKEIVVVSIGVGNHLTELKIGIAEYLQAHRGFYIYHLNVDNMDDAKFATALSRSKCHGIISNTYRPQRIAMLREKGVPFVDLTGNLEDDDYVVSVDHDPAKIGRLAAESFLRRGFTNFAYVYADLTDFSKKMMGAFRQHVENAGCKCIALDPAGTEPGSRVITKLLDQWIATLPPHTALFCANDWRAESALFSCLKAGRIVPDEIAIMGVDNDIPRCLGAAVPLSSIDPNWRGLGYAAMRIMAHILEHPVKPKKRPVFRVPPRGIVERKSTAIYPVNPPWLANALALLDTKMDQPLSAADLATAAGVSQTALQEAFHKTFGTSAGKYILSVKMREAQRLVNDGYLSVKEMAARLGYSSQSYFCRAYSSYYGRPPSKARGNS